MKHRGMTVTMLPEILRASNMGLSPNGVGAIRVGADIGVVVELNAAQRAAEEKRQRKLAKRAGR
jgi:hypothetical protein